MNAFNQRFTLVLFGLLLGSKLTLAENEIPTLHLSLAEVEAKAVASSLKVQLAQANLEAAIHQSEVQKASLFPRLTIDGSYRYLSEVPSAQIGPSEIAFGQHHNYSVGPILTYELFDGGAKSKAYEGAVQLAKARGLEKNGSRLQVVFATRLAYSQVQLGLEQLRLVAESLRLAQARLADLGRLARAGSSSHLDLLGARRESLDLRLRYEQAQGTLAHNLRKLSYLIGSIDLPKPLLPVGSELAKTLPQDVSSPSLIVEFDSFEAVISSLKESNAVEPNPSHPSLVALRHLAQASKLAAISHSRTKFPSLKAYAKSSLDYPHGPLDEKVWQNTVGLSISMPLFDGSMQRGLTEQKLAEARAVDLQREELAKDFRQSWETAESNYDNLARQAKVVQESIELAKKELRLVYTNYQAGATKYLEVQRANNEVLESQFTLARLKALMLAQLATLNQLSAKEIKP